MPSCPHFPRGIGSGDWSWLTSRESELSWDFACVTSNVNLGEMGFVCLLVCSFVFNLLWVLASFSVKHTSFRLHGLYAVQDNKDKGLKNYIYLNAICFILSPAHL